MAGTDGSPGAAVDELLRQGRRFSFYQAIRLLHAVYPDAPRLGTQGPPERERVRLRPSLNLNFGLADIATVDGIESPRGLDRIRLTVNFMGLYGSASPLPAHYTEEMLDDEQDDSLLRGFLDLFHHRLLSLLYRVWEKYRHAVQYDPAGQDWYSLRLLGLLGADTAMLPRDQHLRPGRLLAYAGLMTQQPRSAASLQALLADHFPEGGVEVESCRARWCEVPAGQRNALGRANCRLGTDLTVGERVLDRAGNFGIRVGPLAVDDFDGFLPPGDSMAQLRELVDLFNGDGLDYEVTLVLHGPGVPGLQLNSQRARLGWSTWLGRADAQDQEVTFRYSGWSHGGR